MSVPSLGEEKEGLSPWGPALEWNCYWSDRHRLALGEATVALRKPCRQTAGLLTQTGRQLWADLTWPAEGMSSEDGVALGLVSLWL